MNLDHLRPETIATRIYAVGDVHVRLDLPLRLEAEINDDLGSASTREPTRPAF
jgi:hypothetical protein